MAKNEHGGQGVDSVDQSLRRANGPGVVAEQIIVRLGHLNGNVTTVGFPFPPGHDDIEVIRSADHEALNDHSKRMRTWLLALPDHHQAYWLHVMQVDHLWPAHSDHPPVWVSVPDHPDLEQAIAEHFSERGHSVKVVTGEQADRLQELGRTYGSRALGEVLG